MSVSAASSWPEERLQVLSYRITLYRISFIDGQDEEQHCPQESLSRLCLALLQELWRRSYYGEGSEDEIKRHHEAKQARWDAHETSNGNQDDVGTIIITCLAPCFANRFLEMFATEFPSYPISLLSSIDPTTIVEHGTFYRSPEQ
eukprot:scaffold131642_cov19-Tisochrysis_lutea.AAC.1